MNFYEIINERTNYYLPSIKEIREMFEYCNSVVNDLPEGAVRRASGQGLKIIEFTAYGSVTFRNSCGISLESYGLQKAENNVKVPHLSPKSFDRISILLTDCSMTITLYPSKTYGEYLSTEMCNYSVPEKIYETGKYIKINGKPLNEYSKDKIFECTDTVTLVLTLRDLYRK